MGIGENSSFKRGAILSFQPQMVYKELFKYRVTLIFKTKMTT